MSINALSYIGVNSDKIEDWKDFATKKLGMQKTDHSKKSLFFRMDNQKQRFTISGEPGDKLAFLGWEVEEKLDLQKYAKKLEDAGASAIMPLASPIGSGLGLLNKINISLIIKQSKVPVIVDAGIGTPSDATIAMEMGCDGVLINIAIAVSYTHLTLPTKAHG